MSVSRRAFLGSFLGGVGAAAAISLGLREPSVVRALPMRQEVDRQVFHRLMRIEVKAIEDDMQRDLNLMTVHGADQFGRPVSEVIRVGRIAGTRA